MRQAVLSILVDDSAGVLSRVSGLFSRRGYNIESITAGPTQTPKISRLTVAVTGDDNVLEQIRKQLLKLVDVREVVELPSDASVCKELILVKVQAGEKDRQALIAIAEIFRAKIVDVSKRSMIIELTGNQNKLNAFTELLEGFTILEIARTGFTGLARGSADLK